MTHNTTRTRTKSIYTIHYTNSTTTNSTIFTGPTAPPTSPTPPSTSPTSPPTSPISPPTSPTSPPTSPTPPPTSPTPPPTSPTSPTSPTPPPIPPTSPISPTSPTSPTSSTSPTSPTSPPVSPTSPLTPPASSSTSLSTSLSVSPPTTPPPTIPTSSGCGHCQIDFEQPNIFTWQTKVVTATLAQIIIIIDSINHITRTEFISSSLPPSGPVPVSVPLIEGNAVVTITAIVTTSGIPTTIISVLTSPTPYIDLGDNYVVHGTYQFTPTNGPAFCTAIPLGQNENSTTLNGLPLSSPTTTIQGSCAAATTSPCVQVSQSVLDMFPQIPVFRTCAPGTLSFDPHVLTGVAYITATQTQFSTPPTTPSLPPAIPESASTPQAQPSNNAPQPPPKPISVPAPPNQGFTSLPPKPPAAPPPPFSAPTIIPATAPPHPSVTPVNTPSASKIIVPLPTITGSITLPSPISFPIPSTTTITEPATFTGGAIRAKIGPPELISLLGILLAVGAAI
ncbi:MAG: Mucin-2 [Icmadophila ericetorum]|nr:Mucin-2 [Icmadophila ericetorum]